MPQNVEGVFQSAPESLFVGLLIGTVFESVASQLLCQRFVPLTLTQ